MWFPKTKVGFGCDFVRLNPTPPCIGYITYPSCEKRSSFFARETFKEIRTERERERDRQSHERKERVSTAVQIYLLVLENGCQGAH